MFFGRFFKCPEAQKPPSVVMQRVGRMLLASKAAAAEEAASINRFCNAALQLVKKNSKLGPEAAKTESLFVNSKATGFSANIKL